MKGLKGMKSSSITSFTPLSYKNSLYFIILWIPINSFMTEAINVFYDNGLRLERVKRRVEAI